MATIREIAEKSGFSIATVSKVLNHQAGVSRKTCDAIEKVAKNLNYRPNLSARNLKTGMSRTLGIIAEDLTVFNTPGIVDGVGVCCDAHRYHYILGNLRFDKRFGHRPGLQKEKTELVRDMLDEMLSKQVDGILYIGCHSHQVANLKRMGNIPFACSYSYSENPEIPSVVYDDRSAARSVAELFLARGHKRIGIIAGEKDSIHTENRLLGFQEALFEGGVPYNPYLISYGEWNRDHGYRSIEPLLEKGVTAVFAHNDLIALGIIDYCNKNNIRIGQDLDLVGFDNREIAEVCRPSLTTVSLPLFDIGYKAAEILLEEIEGKTPPERKILLECRIVERDSTGTAPLS